MEEFQRGKYIFSELPSIIDVSEQGQVQRQKQISLMIREAFLYKVLLKDLVREIPNIHEKNIILNIAFYILRDLELFERFQNKRELPIRSLYKIVNITKGFLEKWQEYIIVYTIIFSNPNYKGIQDYLRVEETDSTDIAMDKMPRINGSKEYRGIILKASKRANIILTSDGTFVKIRKSDENILASEVVGKAKKGIKNLKIKLSIVAILLLFLAFGAYREYTTVASTIVVDASIQVKIEVNRFNKVVYIYSSSDNGKEMLDSVSPMEDSIDLVLKRCIEYANNNKMISSDGVLITINGEPIDYGVLNETRDYASQEKIKVLINNVGNQQKLQ